MFPDPDVIVSVFVPLIVVPDVSKVIFPSFVWSVSIVIAVPRVTGPVIETELLATSAVVRFPPNVTPSSPSKVIVLIPAVIPTAEIVAVPSALPASTERSSSPEPVVAVNVIGSPPDWIVVVPAVSLIAPVSNVIASSDALIVGLVPVSLISLPAPAAAAWKLASLPKL